MLRATRLPTPRRGKSLATRRAASTPPLLRLIPGLAHGERPMTGEANIQSIPGLATRRAAKDRMDHPLCRCTDPGLGRRSARLAVTDTLWTRPEDLPKLNNQSIPGLAHGE